MKIIINGNEIEEYLMETLIVKVATNKKENPQLFVNLDTLLKTGFLKRLIQKIAIRLGVVQ